MKKLIALVIMVPVLVLAQASPLPSPVPVAPSAVSSIWSWFVTNWSLLASVLLGLSESLALLFPSNSGFGGILASIIGLLRKVGAKQPGPQS